jgi:hypothetical protein
MQIADSVTERTVGPVEGYAVCGQCHGEGSRPCGELCSLRVDVEKTWK